MDQRAPFWLVIEMDSRVVQFKPQGGSQMDITEIRIKLCSNSKERLLGFCSITIDGAFVVRDLKIISGTKGAFVAMPSRKLCDRCSKCGFKNHLRANYCSQCGGALDAARAGRDELGRSKLFADIAHPINSACRDLIQNKVLQAYEQELLLSQREGYFCRYDDFGEEVDDDELPVGPPSGVHQRLDPPGPLPAPAHTTRPQVVAAQLESADSALHVEFEEDGVGAGIFS